MAGEVCESEIQCPYCGEPITVEIDTSVASQTYIEDCSVCCRPIEIRVSCDDGELSSLSAERSQ
jgi:hypothetical protein